MRKTYRFLIIILLQTCFAITTSAQESNLKEDYSAYLPEIRALNKMLSQIPHTGTVLTKDGLLSARNMMKSFAGGKTILQPTFQNIKGPGGDLSLMIFKPDTINAIVLDIHGGAWSVGVAANDAALNDEMARTCHVAVVSVEYRLAPEFPFPACIEDCKAAARWLLGSAKKEFGTDKIFISGASAGGHLAAVTTLYIRDSLKAIEKIKGVNLQYGCFDLNRTPSNRLVTDSTLLLYKKSLDESFKLVFGNWTLQQLQNPEYSPLYADLKGLPPALFTVGTADPLIDDTFFMETRWRNAGNKTFLAVYPECPHGLNILPTKIAKVANARMYKWIIDLCK
ncbi:MAG: alpha/beta hydrolase [Bacteroidota bacterium]